MNEEWAEFLEGVKAAANGGGAEEAPCRWFKSEHCHECTVKAARHDDCMEAMLLDIALKAGELGLHEGMARAKSPRLKRLERDPRDRRHGTVTGYTAGCRCKDCKAVMRDYQRRRRTERSGHGNS